MKQALVILVSPPVQVNDQKHEKNILAKTCTKGNECTVCTWLDTRMPRNMFVVLIF